MLKKSLAPRKPPLASVLAGEWCQQLLVVRGTMLRSRRKASRRVVVTMESSRKHLTPRGNGTSNAAHVKRTRTHGKNDVKMRVMLDLARQPLEPNANAQPPYTVFPINS